MNPFERLILWFCFLTIVLTLGIGYVAVNCVVLPVWHRVQEIEKKLDKLPRPFNPFREGEEQADCEAGGLDDLPDEMLRDMSSQINKILNDRWRKAWDEHRSRQALKNAA